MANPTSAGYREALLAELNTKPQYGGDPNLQSVLNAAAKRLGIASNPALEKALLTQWGELFRAGLVAWGRDLNSPGPPNFHATAAGQDALANLARDPSNPAGYLRHLSSMATVNPVAQSYLGEALNCYVGGSFKAAAVLTGAAAESIILHLRDTTVQKLESLPRTPPKKMTDWQVKTVSDALHVFLSGQKGNFDRSLREEFESYWMAFTQQIRAARNEVGHPTSIDPVTYDAVHASLLIFPELAKLANSLERWVKASLA